MGRRGGQQVVPGLPHVMRTSPLSYGFPVSKKSKLSGGYAISLSLLEVLKAWLGVVFLSRQPCHSIFCYRFVLYVCWWRFSREQSCRKRGIRLPRRNLAPKKELMNHVCLYTFFEQWFQSCFKHINQANYFSQEYSIQHYSPADPCWCEYFSFH